MIEYSLTIENKLEEIETVSNFFEEKAKQQQISFDVIYKVQLIVDELITNIISYGYHDKKIHLINICFQLSNELIFLEIIDDGIPFNPLESPDVDVNLSIEDKKIGGLGIFFIKKFAKILNYELRENKNYLKISINTND